MGRWRNGWLLLTAGWGSALVIIVMDVMGLRASLASAWRIITGG
jgi:manganese transport protein